MKLLAILISIILVYAIPFGTEPRNYPVGVGSFVGNPKLNPISVE